MNVGGGRQDVLVLLVQLADTWTEVATTRSRHAKRDLLAAALADASPDDLAIAVSYLAGRLRQRRTGLGWRSLAELPPAAASAELTLVETDSVFEAIAGLSGAGSTKRRAALAADLFARATAAEQAFLRGLVLGDLRQGALEAVVQDAMARAYGVEPQVLRRAAMLLSSTTEAADLLARGGAEALGRVQLRVGTPVQPMLAASAPDPDAALIKVGTPAMADVKLDGIRVQVHRQGADVAVYTRSLDEITERLPEVVAAVLALPVTSVVLDGEVLALRPDGRPEVFQLVASRAASRTAEEGSELALRVFFFDVLHVDGRTLLDVPLVERDAELARIVGDEQRIQRRTVDTVTELRNFFASVVAGGFEGLVVKRPDSVYSAGRRQAWWVKVKPRHTFDLLVTGVEWGYGRREGWLSNIHLAARDASTGAPIILGKTFKGMTDDLLRWQTEHFQRIEISRDRHTVYVEPTTVVEIACDGLQASVRYPGGVALRFARVLRYRPDKPAAEADTLEDLKRLLGPPEAVDATPKNEPG